MLAACQAAGLLSLLAGWRDGPRLIARLAFAATAGVAMIALTAPHWMVFLDTLHSALTAYDRPAAALFPLEAAPQILLDP